LREPFEELKKAMKKELSIGDYEEHAEQKLVGKRRTRWSSFPGR